MCAAQSMVHLHAPHSASRTSITRTAHHSATMRTRIVPTLAPPAPHARPSHMQLCTVHISAGLCGPHTLPPRRYGSVTAESVSPLGGYLAQADLPVGNCSIICPPFLECVESFVRKPENRTREARQVRARYS